MKKLFGFSIVTVAAVILLFSFEGFAVESNLKFELTPGPYAVGFKAVNNYDYARTYYAGYDIAGNKVSEKARPIQTSVWYPADPAKAKTAKRMVFREYAYLMAHELGYRELTDTVKTEAVTQFHLFFSTPPEKRVELDVVTNAVRDAVPAEGKFPLVVYGPSINCVSFENSVLFEHLASYGYIVVASPCLGPTSRNVPIELAGTETQARDILFLLGYMWDFPGVDRDKIALMGYSWGGMSNVLAAMRDTRIGVVVCLDGSVVYNKYFDEMFVKSIYYNIDHITMPLLFLRSKKIPDEILKKYGAQPQDHVKFYDQLKYSDAYFIRFNHMMHGDFCSAFLKFMDYKGPDNLESSPEEVNRSYNLMCKYVQNFLDAYIKGDHDALTFMSNSPGENGIADGVIDKQFKKGIKQPPSFGEFVYRVKTAGFGSIRAVYEEIKKDFPGFIPGEESLTDLAYNMFSRRQVKEVLLLLNFTVHVHPKSWMGYYGLGEVYAALGDKEAAVKALKKALELNPKYIPAQKKLEEIQ